MQCWENQIVFISGYDESSDKEKKMWFTTNILVSLVILLAPNVEAHAGDMTDEQMLKRAVEVISKEDPHAIVTPVQAKNQHIEPWVLKNPLLEYRFFCARLNTDKEKAAPNRRFLAVKRTGQVIDSIDGARFSQLPGRRGQDQMDG